jgi:hypothetical protein
MWACLLYSHSRQIVSDIMIYIRSKYFIPPYSNSLRARCVLKFMYVATLYERLRPVLSLFSDLKLFEQFIEYNEELQSVILTKYQDDHNNGNEMNGSFVTYRRQD